MPADSAEIITVFAPPAFSAFAGKYNQTLGPGAGPSGNRAFAQVGGKLSLYVTNNYWTFCAALGEPANICADARYGGKPIVVGKATLDDPTTVTSWQSLATDGRTLTPLPCFKATGECEVPLNCGLHDGKTVCGHAFQGCDVCSTCCKPFITKDADCTQCTITECKSDPDCCVSFDCTGGQCKRAYQSTGNFSSLGACEAACAPECTTYSCIFPAFQCVKAAGSSGQFPSQSACESACVKPAGACTGKSADLAVVECSAWQELYDVTNGPKWSHCSDARSDPCSCSYGSGDGGVYCSGGHFDAL
jgi:hypothetical protein